MNKVDRVSLQVKVEKMRSVKGLLESEGWKAFLVDIVKERGRHYKTLLERIDSPPHMVKAAGRVDTLDDVLAWADRVIREGTVAFEELVGRKKPEAEREEGDE